MNPKLDGFKLAMGQELAASESKPEMPDCPNCGHKLGANKGWLAKLGEHLKSGAHAVHEAFKVMPIEPDVAKHDSGKPAHDWRQDYKDKTGNFQYSVEAMNPKLEGFKLAVNPAGASAGRPGAGHAPPAGMENQAGNHDAHVNAAGESFGKALAAHRDGNYHDAHMHLGDVVRHMAEAHKIHNDLPPEQKAAMKPNFGSRVLASVEKHMNFEHNPRVYP